MGTFNSWNYCCQVRESPVLPPTALSNCAILPAGANINVTDHDGDTPLHICELPDMAEFLLAHGADETALNAEGKSVYEQAVELENDDMIQFWANRLGITVTMREGGEGEEEWQEGEGAYVGEDDACEEDDGGDSAGAPVSQNPN